MLCAQCSLIAHAKCAGNAPPTCDLRAHLLLYANYAEKEGPASAYALPAAAAAAAAQNVAMSDVPDPVFAEEMVGPGVAIEPEPGRTTVVSPIAGKVVKVLPHAFVVLGDGVGVLVHLGINTVRLEGEGFEVLATQGSEVAAGDHHPDPPTS